MDRRKDVVVIEASAPPVRPIIPLAELALWQLSPSSKLLWAVANSE